MSETDWISARTLALARLARLEIAAYLALFTALYTALDMTVTTAMSLYGLAGFAAWGAGYLLLLRLLGCGGSLPDGLRSGVGTYFAICFVTSLAIGAGLVVLLVPGLYLLMRWLPSYARALASDDGVTGSLRWSWRATEPFQGVLARQLVGPIACYVPPVAIMVHWEFVYWKQDAYSFTYELLASILVNLFISVSSAWIVVLCASSFDLIRSTADEIDA